jgi:glutathione S-transferase
MQLFYQTHSPFARKVLVFAHEIDLARDLEVVHHETSPTLRNAGVFAVNPLGKVPVLIRSRGEAPLFDSDVICAYLDTLHRGRKLIPPDGEQRWQALEWQAVAQGLCEAGIAVRWESVRRPEPLRYQPLLDGYIEKMMASYAWLERNFDSSTPMTIGHIALATALSWIEFRGLPGFRAGAPQLARWFDAFQARPSMRATPLSGETHDRRS